MKFTSDVISGASGSIGGSTWSHNRGGQYIRKRAIPTNPSSGRQNAVRTAFTGLVNAWGTTLTPEERLEWTNFANQTPQTDTLGQQLILTGQQAYIKANTARLNAGLARVDTAPTQFDNGVGVSPLEPNDFQVDAGPPVEFTILAAFPAGQPDTGNLLFYVGPKMNPSRNFYKGPYQLAGVGSFIGDATTATITAEVGDTWLADYAPAVGDYFPYAMRVTLGDGRLSPIVRGFIVATAAA